MARQKEPTPPGIKRRFRPKFHYELFVCGARGHELLGTTAAAVRPEDAFFVRESGGLRWYRCLRCDSWLPLSPPAKPRVEFPPDEDEIDLPLRGRALRDRIVLRIIAIDRAIHFLVLAALAVLIFAFASHRAQLQKFVNRLDAAFYGSSSNHGQPAHGVLHDLERLVTLNVSTLRLIGYAAVAYAALEGAEAVGLWFQKRWAEYLTLVATALFLPLEIYELSETISALKLVALAANLAILFYLLLAKRLFGLRGGAEAEHAARERDSGWDAFHRLTPGDWVPAEET
ncbi:MAG TPA: DUF2127 domain-containing protein [Gaiellaceae bacterium]|nr:DUF2127 domain-containing protein [Gaiellaceae bacterium]